MNEQTNQSIQTNGPTTMAAETPLKMPDSSTLPSAAPQGVNSGAGPTGPTLGESGNVGAPASPAPMGNGNIGASGDLPPVDLTTDRITAERYRGDVQPLAIDANGDKFPASDIYSSIPDRAAAAIFPPPNFEQRMGATIQREAMAVEAEGKAFAMSFRGVLEHACEAHLEKFNGDVSAFETNLRMHLAELLDRVKETGRFIR